MGDRPLIRLLAAADLPAGSVRKCVVSGRSPLAVFNLGGEFFVIDDTCTHGMASLSEGTLDGDVIECPWHAGAFNVRTGEPAGAPCTVGLAAYPVTVQGGDICIESAFKAPQPASAKDATVNRPDHGQTPGRIDDMTLQELTDRVRKSVGDEAGLNATVKFVFPEEGIIYIDGLTKPNTVSNADTDSTITITVSRENFEKIIDKQLNPKFALMTGKLRLRGDIRVAMRLDRVFGIE
jgi:nitrite reductase/ring-hydroxylating ferredoxin subunit/putative sterol carrier protein